MLACPVNLHFIQLKNPVTPKCHVVMGVVIYGLNGFEYFLDVPIES